MVRPKEVNRSSWRRWVLFAVPIGLGVVLSRALAIKVVVFNPNWPFKPACIGSSGGVYILEGFQTELFRDEVASRALNHMMEHGYRVDRKGVYVSLLDLDVDLFLNHTTKVLQYLEEVEMNKLVANRNYIEVKKSRGQFPPRPSDRGDIDCELVAAVAIVGEAEYSIP